VVDSFKITAGMFEGSKFLSSVLRQMRHSDAFQKKIMTGIGEIACNYAKDSFDRQAFGNQIWPERYPKQQGGKANVAGILADFLNGKKNPPDRRFTSRPAGIDSGNLKRSLVPAKAVKATGFSVEIGSVQQNASAVQFGATSTQHITQNAVKLLADFMRKSRGRIKKAKKVSQPITSKDAGIQRLGFLFGFAKKGKPLVTKSAPRPYLGINNELEDKLINFIVETFEDMNQGTSGFVKK
jgi:hypothetical protein